MSKNPTAEHLRDNGILLDECPVGHHNEANQESYFNPNDGHIYSVTEYWDDSDQRIVVFTEPDPNRPQAGDVQVEDDGLATIIPTSDGEVYLTPAEVEDLRYCLRAGDDIESIIGDIVPSKTTDRAAAANFVSGLRETNTAGTDGDA